MPENTNWTNMERLLDRISIPYTIASILFGLVLYVIYILFDIKLGNSIITQQRPVMALEAATVTYLLCGYLFMLTKMSDISLNLNILINEKNGEAISQLKKRFNSKWYYIILFITIYSFYMIDWRDPLDNIDLHNLLYSLFFIYINFVLGFIILSLLAKTVWTVLNITYSIYDASNKSQNFNASLSINSFDIKIKSIRSMVIQVLKYYFLGIALLILTYFGPVRYGIYEIAILISLLIIGLVSFIFGLRSIQRILRARLEYESDIINQGIHAQNQKLIFIISDDDYLKSSEKMTIISNASDMLRKQRDDLTKVESRIFNFSSIGSFVTSFLIPALSLISKIEPQLTSFLSNQDVHNILLDISKMIGY
jgi:hypothetical protein